MVVFAATACSGWSQEVCCRSRREWDVGGTEEASSGEAPAPSDGGMSERRGDGCLHVVCSCYHVQVKLTEVMPSRWHRMNDSPEAFAEAAAGSRMTSDYLRVGFKLYPA